MHKKVKNMNLIEFIQDKEVGEEFNNLQTKIFGTLSNLTFHKNIIPSKKTLENAKKNIRKYFQVIGLLERFDESLVLFKQTCDWKKISYIKKNTTNNKEKQPIPKKTLDIIKKNNKFDIELYKFAEDLFQKQIENQDEDFYKELKKLKRQNKFLKLIKIKYYNRYLGKISLLVRKILG